MAQNLNKTNKKSTFRFSLKNLFKESKIYISLWKLKIILNFLKCSLNFGSMNVYILFLPIPTFQYY